MALLYVEHASIAGTAQCDEVAFEQVFEPLGWFQVAAPGPLVNLWPVWLSDYPADGETPVWDAATGRWLALPAAVDEGPPDPEPEPDPEDAFVSTTWVPAYWKSFRDATVVAKIAVISDELAMGFGAATLATGWVGNMTTSLQTAYGDAGSGWLPTTKSREFWDAEGVSQSFVDEYPTGLVTFTGQWEPVHTSAGPGGNGRVMACTDVNATCVGVVRGTAIQVYYLGGNPAFTVKVDAASPVAVTAKTEGVQVYTVSGLASGNHTVTVTYGNTETVPLQVIGFYGEIVGANGVIVNNYSSVGATTSLWANDPLTDSTRAPSWAGGQNMVAHLAVISLGLRSCAAGVDAREWSRDLRGYLDELRDSEGVPGQIDLLFVIQHAGKLDVHRTWHQYVAETLVIADAYQAGVVNFWGAGKASWEAMRAAGRWTSESDVGAAGTHDWLLSTAGHSNLAGLITPLLTTA